MEDLLCVTTKAYKKWSISFQWSTIEDLWFDVVTWHEALRIFI